MIALITAAQPPAELDATVRFLTREERTSTPQSVPEAEFSAKTKSSVFFHAERLLCVGLGDGAKLDTQALRTAAGVAARVLAGKGRKRIAVELGTHTSLAGAVAEGFLLGAYRFDQFKKKGEAGGTDTDGSVELTLLCPAAELPTVRAAVERGRVLAEAANYAREVGNQPGNLFYPEKLAEAARELAAGSGGSLEVTVLDEEALRAGGFGGLLAVGGGSERPPRLIVLSYQGGPEGEAPLVLVGKSITFDSGGLSIKPADRMEEMIWDKCGGMAVLGAMHGVAALRPARNITAILTSAENLTGPGAYRPGDIVTVYDGKQIEINNTDAEGRVVLADALGYAVRDCHAGAIIDLATLTGACVVALGESAAGLWSTSDALRDEVLAASRKSGERLWPMPLYEDYSEMIKSDVALIKNSSGRWAGACTAAAFLRTFVGETPWCTWTSRAPRRSRRTAPTWRAARRALACGCCWNWSPTSEPAARRSGHGAHRLTVGLRCAR